MYAVGYPISLNIHANLSYSMFFGTPSPTAITIAAFFILSSLPSAYHICSPWYVASFICGFSALFICGFGFYSTYLNITVTTYR